MQAFQLVQPKQMMWKLWHLGLAQVLYFCRPQQQKGLIVADATTVVVMSTPDGLQLCVSELGRVDSRKVQIDQEQASMVRVMDSLPYLSIHTFIHTLWSTF